MFNHVQQILLQQMFNHVQQILYQVSGGGNIG